MVIGGELKTNHLVWGITLCGALLFLNSCGTGDANALKNEKSAVANNDSAAVKAAMDGEKVSSAVPVEVTSVTRGHISNYLQYSATLETEQQVDVYPRIGGLVEAIYVEEGQKVSKNQRLLQIEKREYELAEQKARLEYQKQQAEFNRLKALQEQQLLSQEEFENASYAFRSAEIAWKQAQLNLEWTTVRSPIDGVVGERLVRLGDRVQTTTNLFKIANLNEKIVQIYIPQDEYPYIFKNQKALIRSDVMPDMAFSGQVKRISPIIDTQSGTFKVTVSVKDPENKLLPGMFVNTEIIVDTHEDALLIPKSALIYENERIYFFVVENDTARKVELKKGFEDAEKVELVNDDISENTKVVVLGQNGLKDGTKVKIIEEKTYHWQPQHSTTQTRTTPRTLNRKRYSNS
jgi:membrane fusion protein (multidrug efflux system)